MINLRYTSKLSNAAVIVITKSKLDDYILNSENQTDNYQVLCCDKNGKGRRVACYVRNNLSYIEKDFFPKELENLYFETLILKIKLITVGIVYQDPNQSNFIQTLNENITKLDTLKKNYTFSATSI